MGHHHHLDYNLPAPEFLLDDKRTESSFEEIPVMFVDNEFCILNLTAGATIATSVMQIVQIMRLDEL